MRQAFTATTVTVSGPGEPLMVAFGDVKPDQRVVHSLLFMKDDELRGTESVYLEFNGQENACTGSSIDAVFLEERAIVVRLVQGRWLLAGKVDGSTDRNIREIEARFDIPSSRFEDVRSALEILLAEGCAFHVVPPFPRKYDALREAVEAAGYFADFHPKPERICVASEMFENGLTGVSFWVACRKGVWFISTWGVRFYRIPENASVEAAVVEALRIHRGTPYDFKPELKSKYGLIEVSEDEFERA
jgi:hypothetical protein